MMGARLSCCSARSLGNVAAVSALPSVEAVDRPLHEDLERWSNSLQLLRFRLEGCGGTGPIVQLIDRLSKNVGKLASSRGDASERMLGSIAATAQAIVVQCFRATSRDPADEALTDVLRAVLDRTTRAMEFLHCEPSPVACANALAARIIEEADPDCPTLRGNLIELRADWEGHGGMPPTMARDISTAFDLAEGAGQPEALARLRVRAHEMAHADGSTEHQRVMAICLETLVVKTMNVLGLAVDLDTCRLGVHLEEIARAPQSFLVGAQAELAAADGAGLDPVLRGLILLLGAQLAALVGPGSEARSLQLDAIGDTCEDIVVACALAPPSEVSGVIVDVAARVLNWQQRDAAPMFCALGQETRMSRVVAPELPPAERLIGELKCASELRGLEWQTVRQRLAAIEVPARRGGFDIDIESLWALRVELANAHADPASDSRERVAAVRLRAFTCQLLRALACSDRLDDCELRVKLMSQVRGVADVLQRNATPANEPIHGHLRALSERARLLTSKANLDADQEPEEEISDCCRLMTACAPLKQSRLAWVAAELTSIVNIAAAGLGENIAKLALDLYCKIANLAHADIVTRYRWLDSIKDSGEQILIAACIASQDRRLSAGSRQHLVGFHRVVSVALGHASSEAVESAVVAQIGRTDRVPTRELHRPAIFGGLEQIADECRHHGRDPIEMIQKIVLPISNVKKAFHPYGREAAAGVLAQAVHELNVVVAGLETQYAKVQARMALSLLSQLARVVDAGRYERAEQAERTGADLVGLGWRQA